MISPVLREELRSLIESVSMFMELSDRGDLPEAEARASYVPLLVRILALLVECGAPLKVVGLDAEGRTVYRWGPGFEEWYERETGLTWGTDQLPFDEFVITEPGTQARRHRRQGPMESSPSSPRDEIGSLWRRASMLKELCNRGYLPDAEAREAARPLIERVLAIMIECGDPIKVVGVNAQGHPLYRRGRGLGA